MRAFAMRLLLVLVSLVVGDLGMAAVYRAITGEPFYYRVADPNRAINQKYRLQHPVYHHDLIPNSDLPARWGPIDYEIRTNGLGFKADATGEVPLRSDRHRILILGDSFTEGVGLSYGDTFAGRIDRALAAQGVEVFNAGVSSYSPAIYLAKTRYLIEEVGFEFDELVVFLDISDVQDEAKIYRVDEQGRVQSAASDEKKREAERFDLKDWLRRNSILYAIPRIVKIRRKFSQVPEQLEEHYFIKYPRARWTVDDELFDAWGRTGLQRMAQRMDELVALLRRHDIPLTVAVYPWPTQIYYKDLDSRQSRFWRDWSRERGVRFIDLFPAFVSSDDQANRETILRYFIPDDMHWNGAGHARVAEQFLHQRERWVRATPGEAP